ncbi:MAG: hypothetical protein M1115_07880 [Actinobacteria bacterium]|nr:hypothetical protein [Actinomycetota bacterium]
MLRTSLPRAELTSSEVVSSYKAFSGVERAVLAYNTDLDIRPIRHRSAERVRAQVFLRMLSYYVTFHMERALAPMLFRDDDHNSAETAHTNPVAPAMCSSSRAQKDSHEQDRRPSGGPQLPEPPRRPRDHHRQPNQPDRLQLR